MSAPFTFHQDTPQAVRDTLTQLNASRARVRIWYGDTVSGASFGDEYDVTGSIGKSTGWAPIPLLIHNARSLGGGGLLDNIIIRIVDIASRRVLYTHPTFTTGTYTIAPSADNDASLPFEVFHNSENVANFTTAARAERYIAFMRGERFTK